jgi:hypothetical protein
MYDDTPALRLSKSPTFSPGGITAVWAPQNTREDIFAALKRRETHATSAPRIAMRFYASSAVSGDAQAQKLCDDPGFPGAILGAGGVPMGGDLPGPSAPCLFVLAMKDKTDLERIEIIKLESNTAGAIQLGIQGFPLSGPQTAKACVFWRDPGFDAQKPSVYYARVLEQPSWRWSHYDCLAAPGAADGGCDPSLPADAGGPNVKIQERTWTSPIFFKP